MTLYEMTEAAKTLYAMLDAEEIDEKAVHDTLEGMGLQIKLEDYCKVIRQFTSDAEAYKAEADRLTKKQKTAENAVKRLKAAVLAYMEVAGKETETAGVFTVKVGTSKSVNITDETKIPARFLVEQPPKIDKSSIRKLLLADETVNGAELQVNRNIQIK